EDWVTAALIDAVYSGDEGSRVIVISDANRAAFASDTIVTDVDVMRTCRKGLPSPLAQCDIEAASRIGREGAHAGRDVAAPCCVCIQRVISQSRIEIAACIILHRGVAVCGVVTAACVAKKRDKARGRVVIGGFGWRSGTTSAVKRFKPVRRVPVSAGVV